MTCTRLVSKKARLVGSVTKDEMPGLWNTGVDVICVRRAACVPRDGDQRFGYLTEELVARLAATCQEGGRG